MGIVYAVQTAPGRVKLGYTKDLSKRMKAIEGHAGEARLLQYATGTLQDERNLHAYCREQRIVREFFRHEGPVQDFCDGRLPLDDLPPAAQSFARWTAQRAAERAESEREREWCEGLERRMREAYAEGGHPWPTDGNAVLIHLMTLGPDPCRPAGDGITLVGGHAIRAAIALSASGAAIISDTHLRGEHESADRLHAEMGRGRMAACERQIQAEHRAACPAHVLRSAQWRYRQRNTDTPWLHPRTRPRHVV